MSDYQTHNPLLFMPSDGADFWKHRKCYGHVFTLVKGGAGRETIAPIIVDGIAIEIRRYAPQRSLKPLIEAVTLVLQTLLQQAGGLFDVIPSARKSLQLQSDKIAGQYADCESTRLIREGMLVAGHAFITQVQRNSNPSLDSFEDAALKAVYRQQAAHNIIDPLRDYHIRFQGLPPEQYDALQNELLDRTESDGLLLMKSCLRSKSGVPSKNWRTGGKSPFKNDIASLNTNIGEI